MYMFENHVNLDVVPFPISHLIRQLFSKASYMDLTCIFDIGVFGPPTAILGAYISIFQSMAPHFNLFLRYSVILVSVCCRLRKVCPKAQHNLIKHQDSYVFKNSVL